MFYMNTAKLCRRGARENPVLAVLGRLEHVLLLYGLLPEEAF